MGTIADGTLSDGKDGRGPWSGALRAVRVGRSAEQCVERSEEQCVEQGVQQCVERSVQRCGTRSVEQRGTQRV